MNCPDLGITPANGLDLGGDEGEDLFGGAADKLGGVGDGVDVDGGEAGVVFHSLEEVVVRRSRA